MSSVQYCIIAVSVSYLCSLHFLIWLPLPAASPAAGCPFLLHPAAVPSEESPPSARQHSAGQAASAGAPQTCPAAHRPPLPAAVGPGSADVERAEDSPDLGSLDRTQCIEEERVDRKPKGYECTYVKFYQGTFNSETEQNCR